MGSGDECCFGEAAGNLGMRRGSKQRPSELVRQKQRRCKSDGNNSMRSPGLESKKICLCTASGKFKTTSSDTRTT